MGIAGRIVSIFKADIHGVMDQFEDQGLLLKQCLRDMAEALHQKEAKLGRKMAQRNRTQKELDKYDQQHRALDHDLTVAVGKGKDDIARMLIRKTKPLSDLCAELADRVAAMDDEITRYQECLDQQRIHYEQLKVRSAEFFQRSERQAREKEIMDITLNRVSGELSADEIELELLKRKEALIPA